MSMLTTSPELKDLLGKDLARNLGERILRDMKAIEAIPAYKTDDRLQRARTKLADAMLLVANFEHKED